MRYAVDGILFRENKIVLIKRKGRTFHDYWAIPGGIVEEGETVEKALIREMMEELNVKVKPKAILGVYSSKDRDPRDHTISVVFVCEYEGELKAGDDAEDWALYPLAKINNLKIAFDHKKILTDFSKWLEKKGTYWSSK